MRISDWSSDVCSSDRLQYLIAIKQTRPRRRQTGDEAAHNTRIFRQHLRLESELIATKRPGRPFKAGSERAGIGKHDSAAKHRLEIGHGIWPAPSATSFMTSSPPHR